jgi:DNA-binding LacI/PurR family transcriptional regulator
MGAGMPVDVKLRKSLRLIDERRVDGLIIFDSARASNPAEINKAGVPFVAIYQPENNKLYSVLVNNFAGAFEATTHLIEHGYSKIAMLTGLSITSDSRERVRGYKKALQDHGLPVDPKLIVVGTFGEDPSVPNFIRHFQRHPWPQAVFAANDVMALGLQHYIKNHKDESVRATAIVGFDDIEAARHVGLTTVRVDTREVGRRAAQMLFDLLEGKSGIPRKQTVPTTLVIRSSCGCFAAKA